MDKIYSLFSHFRTGSPTSKDKRERDEAINLMESAKYSAAIPLFLDLIESDSEDCTIHYMVGQCYKFNGQLPEAIESLKKAQGLMKDSATPKMEASIYLALGIAYQNSKEFEKAVTSLETGISECPKTWKLHNSLGLTFKIMNEPRKALVNYEIAQQLIVEAASSEAEAYETRILIKDGSKTLLVDMEKFRITLKSSPNYCTILNNIGGVYIYIGDLESAENALKESIEFIPDGFDYPPPQEGLDLIKSMKTVE